MLATYFAILLLPLQSFSAPVSLPETVNCFEKAKDDSYQRRSYAAVLTLDEDLANWQIVAGSKIAKTGYLIALESPEFTLELASGRTFEFKLSNHSTSFENGALIARTRSPRRLIDLFEKDLDFNHGRQYLFREPGNFTIPGVYKQEDKTGRVAMVYRNGHLAQLNFIPNEDSLQTCSVGQPFGG